MKKQNIIILGVFIFTLIIFSLFSCGEIKQNEEVLEEETFSDDDEIVEMPKYVDIVLSGELERTGSYNVPAHWNLKMLFDYAGVKANGDISGFNLTDMVEDGICYDVPKASDNIKKEAGKININTASIDELVTIPGIGEVLAKRIISYREQYPFCDINEIKNVIGIGDYVYEKIKNFITV